MTTVAFISVIFLTTYIFMLLMFMHGWKKQSKIDKTHLHPTKKPPTITVIVACKNEEDNITNLLNSLLAQSSKPTQIICIDDHSTDNTLHLLQKYAAQQTHITVLEAQGKGKKAALAQGIQKAENVLIVCTDADCIVPPQWIEKIAESYATEEFDMLILPVKMTSDNNSIFQQIQVMEFSTLIASGGSMANIQHPIMCNGANLAFSKAAWTLCKHDLHPELISGDDVFLLHSFKKRGFRIRFLKQLSATVHTTACKTLRIFVEQRSRWISKAGAYTDWDTILVACNVLFINTWMLVLAISTFFVPQVAYYLLAMFIVKWFIDSLFLYQTRLFFGHKHIGTYSFLLSLTYPFYVLGSAIGGIFKVSSKN